MRPEFAASVVIPTFNRSALVQRAIRSVLEQTHSAAEIIVVDDGSTDDTPRVVQAFGPPVRYLRQDNAGVSAARNHGIDKATGDWIAFLDSDDEWRPAKLQMQFAVLRKHPQLRWCACTAETMDGPKISGHPLGLRLERELAETGYFSNFFQAWERGALFQTAGIMVNSDLLRTAGGFDQRLNEAEDEDLWSRVALLSPAIGYVAEPLYLVHADTPGSLSKGGRRLESTLTSVAKVLPLAEARGGEIAEIYRRFIRGKVFRMMLRAAGQGVKMRDLHAMAHEGLGITWLQWRCLGMLACCPRPLASSLEWRIREWHQARTAAQ